MARSFPNRRISFSNGFEADLGTRELRKEGQKIPLPEKSFEFLALLLARPGQIVRREEFHQKLWPNGTYVDFGHNLNVTVSRLRRALEDSAANPRYIETVGSRGYRFVAPVNSGTERHETSGRKPHNTDKGTIRVAVLPFENYSPGPCPNWLIDGLTEEVIVRLGHLFSPQLGVIARTSTMKYKKNAKDIHQIGRELNVEYVLEGSVRRIADHTCVTANLVRVEDQTHQWAQGYEYELGDILLTQNTAAESIARSVGRQLFGIEGTNSFRRSVPNQEAYRSYLKGCYHQSKRTEGGLRKSIQWFEQAIQDDRSYAPAHNALAVSLILLATIGFSERAPGDIFPQAEDLALRALGLNSTLAECHTTLALVKYFYEWDWVAVERLLNRAMELNPSDPFAHAVYSFYLSSNGRHQEALVESQRGCEYDPLSLSANVSLGTAHYFARQYDKAIVILERVLDLEATFALALIRLGCAYSQNSRHQDAIMTLEKARTHHPTSTTVLAWLGKAYAEAGMKEKACEVIHELETLSKQRYVSALDFALVHAGMGKNDETLQYLERAQQERSPLLALVLPVDPSFDNLRSDSRLQNIIDRILAREKS